MSLRILLVEDEPPMADFLLRGLREEGFTVEHAPDAEVGWRALETQEWDIVLLDWRLPGTDGLTLLRRFRRVNETTSVMLLTARDSVLDRVSGLDSGADDYLCKPFSFEELLARVRSMARRRVRSPIVLLTYETVHVDLSTQRAERNGKWLDLTAKQQSLLVFFLRHPNQMLSRTRIYENVWDERYDGLSNTLEVHIKDLRRKLEAHGPRLIHTFRGRGYWFGRPIDEAGDD